MVTCAVCSLITSREATVKVAFWKMRATCEVTRLDFPLLMAFRTTSTGPIEYEGEFRLEPMGDGTRVSVRAAARLKGIWKLLQPVFAGDARKETQQELNRRKEVLEAPASGRETPWR